MRGGAGAGRPSWVHRLPPSLPIQAGVGPAEALGAAPVLLLLPPCLGAGLQGAVAQVRARHLLRTKGILQKLRNHETRVGSISNLRRHHYFQITLCKYHILTEFRNG